MYRNIIIVCSENQKTPIHVDTIRNVFHVKAGRADSKLCASKQAVLRTLEVTSPDRVQTRRLVI
jgi:hypothetical protein